MAPIDPIPFDPGNDAGAGDDDSSSGGGAVLLARVIGTDCVPSK